MKKALIIAILTLLPLSKLIFSLDASSVVSIIVADANGLNIHTIMNKQSLDEGTHKIQIPRLQPGVSTFCLVVNGNVFEKKVSL